MSEREDDKPDPLDLRIASRFLAAVVAVLLVLMIAAIGAMWSSL